MNLRAFLELLRPMNCLMASFGVFIGYTIAAGALESNPALAAAMAVAFLVCGAGMAVNDYFDRETDAKLHSKKPIPRGRVKAKSALCFSIALFMLGNGIALSFLPLQSVAIAVAFTLLLALYSWKLPKFKYVGNWVVAAGTAFTLVFGASLVGNYAVAGLFAAAAFFANVAREIVKDIEDIEQDTGFKESLPMVVGECHSKGFVFLMLAAAVLLSYAPSALYGFGGPGFLVLLTGANAGFAYSARLVALEQYAKSQKWFKVSMLVALLAFLSGVFV